MRRQRPRFAVDPWQLPTSGLELNDLATAESLFTLSNGHIGIRGSLDEGEPRAVPGTYVNGFYEERPLPHPEAGYGFPESGQTVVTVTDGTLIRLHVGDSPFDMRYGQVQSHERYLDLRNGQLHRSTEWTSPSGSTVRVTSRRLVSFSQRALAAICYEVEPVDGDTYIALQSDLVANAPTNGRHRDPRAAAVLERPLVPELAAGRESRAVLVHRTHRSDLRVAAGMTHVLDLPEDADTSVEASDDMARFTVAVRLPQGSRLRLVKLLAYGWSSRRSAHALRDQVDAALAVARLTGWDGLAEQQREYLDDFWGRSDVVVEGDAELQQAVRVSLFHVLQTGARAEGEALPAKGLTGPGYDGHAFWDTETFVLPLLTYTVPHAARDALRWRHSTLPQARQRAAELGLDGAAFPWRTIHGEETSGYWPAGTAAFHVNADVADAVARYLAATGDTEFETRHGVEVLVETARLWASLGHFAADGVFRIDGVTGPDEYTAVVDDNVYTNLMAQRNLREAAAACRRRPDLARSLDVHSDEVALWCAAADAVRLPYDESLGVHSQSEDFTAHAEWDFESTRPDEYPLMLSHPYFQLYRTQVIKQADLVLAMHLRGDHFTPEQKQRNFAYYEARTVRDSSLSAGTQAVLAAEVGHLQLAHDYWAEAAFADLRNVYGNVDDGLHIACMASTWSVAVAGVGGMRDHDGRVTFAPRLLPMLDRVCFRMGWGECVVRVDVHRTQGREQATYTLVEGEKATTSHHGEPVDLLPDQPVTLPVPDPPRVEPVSQPYGRAPNGRRPGDAAHLPRGYASAR
ncbi:glycoside hydrolase family 65 protein [Thalassiella azotivora]